MVCFIIIQSYFIWSNLFYLSRDFFYSGLSCWSNILRKCQQACVGNWKKKYWFQSIIEKEIERKTSNFSISRHLTAIRPFRSPIITFLFHFKRKKSFPFRNLEEKNTYHREASAKIFGEPPWKKSYINKIMII